MVTTKMPTVTGQSRNDARSRILGCFHLYEFFQGRAKHTQSSAATHEIINQQPYISSNLAIAVSLLYLVCFVTQSYQSEHQRSTSHWSSGFVWSRH